MNSFYERQNKVSNSLVLLFIISLLAIDYFPYFKSMEIINPQFLYLSFLNFIAGVYFYFNKERISVDIIPIIKKSYVCRIYLAFLFFCGLSIIVAKNTSLVLTRFTELVIVFCLFINLIILLKDKLDIIYKIIFIVCISAFFQSFQQLQNFLIVPRGVSIIDLLNNMKGNTGNINILAASLTIKVPFIIVGIFHFTDLKKIFLLTTFIFTSVVILLTGARASLISLFLISIIYIIYYLRENSFQKSSFNRILLLIIPLLVSVFISNKIFEKSNDNSRYVSVENRIKQINSNDNSINKRIGFWKNTIKMTETNPYLGIGLGNYQIESIPYEKTTADEFNVSLHAHNDFLEILAETGIINGLIYLSLFLYVFVANLKNIIKSDNTDKKSISILTFLILVVYGIDAFFNFPMYRPTMQLFFAMLLALTVVNNIVLDQNKTTIKINRAVILIIVSILTSYMAFLSYKASNLEYLINTDDINNNEKGFLDGDEVIKRLSGYPNVFSTSESFYEYAGIYFIREKKFEKALNCFSKASKINGYQGRIDFYKSVISRKKENIDSAYFYLKEAYDLRPKNVAFYTALIHLAAVKKDTIEILNKHKSITTYIDIPEIWITTAKMLEESNLNKKSLVSFLDKGLKEFPNDSTLLKQKNYIFKEKNDALIAKYITEGQNFVDQQNLGEAMKSYQKGLKIDPENIYVMQNIGFYYLNLSQHQKAKEYFLKALKYPGLTNGKTEFYIAVCYSVTGDKINACKYANISRAKNFPKAKELFSSLCQ